MIKKAAKRHYFTKHGVARRVKASLVASLGYWGALNVVTEVTEWPEFLKLITMPEALIGWALIMLSTTATTGK